MKKNFEYKEPEFKVVLTATEDVITTSGEEVTPGVNDITQGTFAGWEMGSFAI